MQEKIQSITQRLFWPRSCALCHRYHRHNHAVCTECMPLFSPLGPACHHCAEPLPEGQFLMCGACSKTLPCVDKVSVACLFQEPIRTLLHQFKYRSGLYLCSFLCTLIKNALSPEALTTECLIPIPLHPKRLRERGFNQAAVLSRYLSKELHLPIDLYGWKKIIHTKPQAQLDASSRKKNLHQACAASPMPYQHVTLIDDLITTGSTVNALAYALKQQGVARVDVWCCAKAANSHTSAN